ncbi:MAG: DUF697 domain-containing protein [Planctomycetota bacterium]|nr:DUF697 domain-containing protein [Planctomycetota bacterium]
MSEDKPTDVREEASKLSEKCAYAAAAVTMIPLPFTEHVAVVPIHVGMVIGLGHIYGFELTKDSVNDLLGRIGAAVGLSLIGSQLVATAAKFVLPLVGGIITAPFMFASTLAIAGVARVYFENGGRISDKEIKKAYNKGLRRAKRSYNPTRAKSAEAQSLAKEAAENVDEKGEVLDPLFVAESNVPEKEKSTVKAAPKTKIVETVADDPVKRLENLKSLMGKGLVDQAEYDEHKLRILMEL